MPKNCPTTNLLCSSPHILWGVILSFLSLLFQLTEIDLLIHLTRVHDNRSFTCEICHAISVGNTNHNNHMRAHNVDVGDLLVMPLQALPSVDPLPVDPFLVDPLPIDDFYNDSFPIDLLPADLDQAFMLPNNECL